MTKEEIFEEANICYNNTKLIINSLNIIAKELDESFDADNSFVKFDMILQALLFCQAIADGDFCKEEKEFIEMLAANNDLFANIESDELKDLTWDKIFNMTIDEQKELSEKINDALNAAANDFVLPLAILDAGTTQDSLLDLSTGLANLALLLGSVDGVLSAEEVNAYQTYSDELILGKWADVKGLTLQVMDEAEAEATE